MARRQHSELAAGIFVLACLVTLIGVIVWMGGAGIFRPTKQTAVFYALETSGSHGLTVGSFVKIGDDQVGKITRIHFDPETDRTLYFSELEREDFQVHSDGRARVAAGLVGGSELVITSRGSDDKPLADQDNAIAITGGLDQTMCDLSSAVAKLNEVIQSELACDDPNSVLFGIHKIMESLKLAAADVSTIAANVLTETRAEIDKSLLAKIHKSMDDLNAMSGSLKTDIAVESDKPLMAKIHASVDDINVITEKVRTYADQEIADLLANLRETSTKILKMSKDFAVVSDEVKEMIVVNHDNVDELLDNMVAVSANLKAASTDIRRNPWRLLHKPDEGEVHSQNIYDAARSFSNGAEQLDQAISKMAGLAKAHPEGVPAEDPTLAKVREHLEDTFEKFTKAESALWKELSK